MNKNPYIKRCLEEAAASLRHSCCLAAPGGTEVPKQPLAPCGMREEKSTPQNHSWALPAALCCQEPGKIS